MNRQELILWHLLPMIEAAVIISALVVALRKLHNFHKKSVVVDSTKLKVHFAISMILMLLFIIDFGRSFTTSRIYSQEESVSVEKM